MMALEEAGFVNADIVEYSALFDKAVAETQNGIAIRIDMLVVVGRKE